MTDSIGQRGKTSGLKIGRGLDGVDWPWVWEWLLLVVVDGGLFPLVEWLERVDGLRSSLVGVRGRSWDAAVVRIGTSWGLVARLCSDLDVVRVVVVVLVGAPAIASF